MKQKDRTTHWFISIIPLLFFMATVTAEDEKEDKTLSPYFKVVGENIGNSENLPLQETSANVEIAGVIADVKIRQVYQNRGENAIEAVYVFPGSTRAAIYGMTMTIGERVVHAKIKERNKAKHAYNEAKSQGKRASLLEQQRPNVFQMNVANIMPGDQVIVELSYTEMIVPEQGIYEFVYPSVVGPRYSEASAQEAAETEAWIANPYLQEGEQAPYLFDINVAVSAGIPIQAISSPSHAVDVSFDEQGTASVALKGKDKGTGDRDYILRYQLKGKQINSGLLLHQGEQDNYFLLMAQPPERVQESHIPPREYIFVVDVSGSMHGFPLDTTKKLMSELLTDLRPSDSFNILFFSGGSSVLAEKSLPVNKNNIDNAIAMMESQRGGGTRLLPALKRAMAFPSDEMISRSFVIVTDGYVSIETEAFQYVKDHLNNANFFAFGIGSSVNRFLIEGLARSGRGEPFVVTSPNEVFQTAMRFKTYIETPVLTGIKVSFDGFEAYDVEPKQVPDLFAEKPLILYGKWRGTPEGKVKINGYRGEESYSNSINIATENSNTNHSALRYLWARNRIAELGDYEKLQPNSERRKEITTLGLTYNLMTAYTSFVAIDEQVVNQNGQQKKVKQPLPLPKGVSNLAVGGVVATTPEPSMVSLLIVLSLITIAVYVCKSRYLKFNLG